MIVHMQRKGNDFRGDIVGLRALAVSLVLLNHFGVPGFGSGFIGVDIFFVISGYLITRVLFKEYILSAEKDPSKSSISLSNFYLRRVRRLLPAALVVIIVVNVISFFLSNPVSREALLSNSKWAVLFLANVSFLRSGSDYFQQGNEPSMLQHYWSLSVEEQFYFIWPILFLLAANFQRLKVRGKFIRFNVRLLGLIFAATFASFCFLLFSFNQSKTEAYFAIFTRAWELGVGGFFGILAFNKSRQAIYSKTEKVLPLLLALGISSLIINSDNWAYVVPLCVLTTGFYLYAGENSQKSPKPEISSLHKVTRRFVLYIGTISYSLYLVHWPILIIAGRFEMVESLVMRLALIPISIFAGHLLWKYVEIPFQRIPLPKKSNIEERLFHQIKARRGVILSLSTVIVGSLYIITYPAATSKFFHSDSSISTLINDPNLKIFSEYQSQLTSGSGTQGLSANNDATTAIEVTGQDLNNLEEKVIQALKSGLSLSKLTETQIEGFKLLKTDTAPFQHSRCASRDTEIPPDCSVGVKSPDAKQVALIGDSKMEAIAQPLIEYFTGNGWRVKPMAMAGCHMSNPSNENMENCEKRSNWIIEHLETNYYDVVISMEFPSVGNFQEHRKYYSTIKGIAGKLIILQSSPQVTPPSDCIKADYSYSRDCSKISSSFVEMYSKVEQEIRSLASTNTFVVDARKWVCVELECPITSSELFTTRDGSHVSYSYVKKISPLIRGRIHEIVER
jgi:peptidoglycan/LPS O-acetylase OafA/YrhL